MSIFPHSAIADQAAASSVFQSQAQGRQTFRFDFMKNEFVTDMMGRVALTKNDRDLLEETIEKILHDERYKYLAYSAAHGNEVGHILSLDLPQDILFSELKRVYCEALIYHPLIQDVRGFSANQQGDKLFVEFTVVGVNNVEIPIRREVTV